MDGTSTGTIQGSWTCSSNSHAASERSASGKPKDIRLEAILPIDLNVGDYVNSQQLASGQVQ